MVLSLALGIGANTAIFTLIDAVLLKSLPLADPAGLVLLGNARESGVGSGMVGSFSVYSYDLYKHLWETNIFERLCAVQSSSLSRVSVRHAGSSVPQPAASKLVSGNYFEVLGVKAAMGRTIAPSDDAPSAPPVAVISFRYWQERLNGDPSAIGSTVDLNGASVAIVGVAPPEFYGETLRADPPSFWLPISADRHLDPQRSVIDAPDQHWLYLMGRLQPNVSVAQGQTRLTAALQSWLFAREGSTISDRRRQGISSSHVELTPGGSGVRHMQRSYAQTLRLLLGISAAVLLIHLRQHREPPARAQCRAPRRKLAPARTRSEPEPPPAAIAHRKPDVGARRRRAGAAGRTGGHAAAPVPGLRRGVCPDSDSLTSASSPLRSGSRARRPSCSGCCRQSA